MKRDVWMLHIVLVLFVMCAASGAWCLGVDAPTQKPVTLKEGGENRIPVGTVMTIVLKENPTTGYIWSFRVSDGTAIRLVDEYYAMDAHPEGVVGVGGNHYFHFRADKAGEYTIEMVESRSWEKDAPAQKTIIYKLQIGDKAAPKPAEDKLEAKPTEAKAEPKPAEGKPQAKPAEGKPEAKPTEAKAEPKPADVKAEANPVETKGEPKGE